MTLPSVSRPSRRIQGKLLRPRPGVTPRHLAIYLLMVLGYGLFFTFWQVETLPARIHVIGVLIFATSLLPLMVWIARQESRVALVRTDRLVLRPSI